jgi:hypothetical protein
MPLIKTDKTVKDVLLNVHQDVLTNFLSVHDEIVVLTDKYLFEPIMTKLTKIIELEKVFKKLNAPYVKFKFDVEYDNFGSYTASNGLDVYQYFMESEKIIQSLLNSGFIKEETISESEKTTEKSEEILTQPKHTEIKEKVFKINQEDYQQVTDKIISLPDGGTVIKINFDDQVFIYNRKVNFN